MHLQLILHNAHSSSIIIITIIIIIIIIIINSMGYGTRRFNAAFTKALQ